MTDWLDSAACAGKHPDLFFDTGLVSAAIAVCHTCPVIHECDQHATALDIHHGVWGGRLRGVRHGILDGYTKGCRCTDCRTKKATISKRSRDKRSNIAKTLTATERQQLAETLERQGWAS